jgi:Protein kinase domain
MKATFTPGTAFAGYRVDSLVGRGGMGVVYRATDLTLGRPVALKLVAPELSEDERFRARFLREPRLAASLDHPNVIPIYEAGEHDGQLYLAMRFVEGSDLKSVLEHEGNLAPERARVALERRGFRAGDYTVGHQSCDPSTPQTGGFEFRKCAANASAFARAEQLVAVVGPYSSYCGSVQIPIINGLLVGRSRW